MLGLSLHPTPRNEVRARPHGLLGSLRDPECEKCPLPPKYGSSCGASCGPLQIWRTCPHHELTIEVPTANKTPSRHGLCVEAIPRQAPKAQLLHALQELLEPEKLRLGSQLRHTEEGACQILLHMFCRPDMTLFLGRACVPLNKNESQLTWQKGTCSWSNILSTRNPVQKRERVQFQPTPQTCSP